MRALVTGSAGFVGRHMCAELARRGWDVDEVDVNDVGWLGIDALEVFRVCRTRYDLVVHCAARSPHRAAIDGAPGMMAANLQLDSALFDWAVRTNQKRVLYLSSSAVYPGGLQRVGAPWLPLEESLAGGDQIGFPPDSYGWVKLTGEAMAAAAAAEGVAVHVVRPFSGYGEDQGIEFPFGAFLGRARRREDPFPIWGSGEQVRDWIHISDLVAGALAVVSADVRTPVNLCTGRGTSMTALATTMCKAAGYSPTFDYLPEAPSGVAYRVGSSVRLREIYTPRLELEDAIATALEEW